MKKRIMALVLAAVLALSLIGCSGKGNESSTPAPTSSEAESKEESSEVKAEESKEESKEESVSAPAVNGKDTLKVAVTTDPEGLDPQKTSATSTFFVTTNIFETLVVVDENWNYVGRLAEDWSINEDYTSITFKLKKGVKFHNGREMTAEDVKYSIERLHEDDSAKKKYYANITGCEIADPYTITFTTEKPDAVLLSSFAYPWSVILPSECAADLKTQPVGTGAYKFVSWIPQQELKLTANEDYHDPEGAAKIPQIVYSIYPDVITAMIGTMDGSVDLVDITGNPIESISGSSDVALFKYPVNSVTVLGMNLDNEYLANEQVRQAMACAIDKEAIIAAVNDGFGDVVGSYLPSGAAEYIDTTKVYSYDVAHAKDLLTQAGYPDGFSITMTLPKSYAVYTNIGLIIADQLEKIGIHCEISQVEWADWMQNVYTDKKYDMTVMANSGRLSSYDFITRFHSQSGDYISFKTGEVDEILDALKTELDGQKRTELIQQFQQIVAEKVPVVPVETQHRVYAMNAKLQGYVMYPTETTEFKLLSFAN